MRGRVVLILFPFDDLTGAKVRPAICLTDPITTYGHIVAAFVSSAIPTPLLATDLLLDPVDPDFGLTGLRVRSVVRLHRLATLTAAMVRRDLGDLSARHLADVDERLRLLFKL
ncbi:MAG TPA: type II toxin-antitoxin system PemK/MazF family toxin [Chloroflexota bacterium]|nr:type II toxin-antitoxin system PemK/MazF family toxin [Chloroflexota bacterium]